MKNIKIKYTSQKRIKKDDLNIPSTVTIVGTGGFGAWVSYFCALAGVKEIILINPGGKIDNGRHNIYERELSIFPYKKSDYGKSKVNALHKLIKTVREEVRVITFNKRFDPKTDIKLLKGIVFAGISNTELHQQIFNLSKKKGLKCYGGTYNGVEIGAFHKLPTNLKIGENTIPVWVGSAAMSALLTIYSAFVTPINYIGKFEELKMDYAKFNKRFIGIDTQI